MTPVSTGNIGYQDYKPVLSLFTDLLKQRLGGSLISVVLYGSIARGNGCKESDVDLLIIQTDAPQVYYQRLEPILETEEEFRKSQPYRTLQQRGLIPYLSCIVLSKEEAEENRYLFLDMIQDSILLLDEEGFFARRLEEMKQRLDALGARKIMLQDGSWYWDLKPGMVAGEEFAL